MLRSPQRSASWSRWWSGAPSFSPVTGRRVPPPSSTHSMIPNLWARRLGSRIRKRTPQPPLPSRKALAHPCPTAATASAVLQKIVTIILVLSTSAIIGSTYPPAAILPHALVQPFLKQQAATATTTVQTTMCFGLKLTIITLYTLINRCPPAICPFMSLLLRRCQHTSWRTASASLCKRTKPHRGYQPHWMVRCCNASAPMQPCLSCWPKAISSTKRLSNRCLSQTASNHTTTA